MTTTATPQNNLQTIIDNWHLLADMLDTHTGAPWPPAGRMTDYLQQLDAYDALAVRRSRAPEELEVPAGQPPLNLDALDAIRTTELALIGTADHIAAQVQHQPMPMPEPRRAAPARTVAERLEWADRSRQVQEAQKDAADPRRWSWTNPATRTPALAAVWLQHRLDAAPGPFRPLDLRQLDHVADVARESARRVESALVIARRGARLPHPCPHCRRQLTIEGGDGQPPAVRCTSSSCGWTRTAELEGAA